MFTTFTLKILTGFNVKTYGSSTLVLGKTKYEAMLRKYPDYKKSDDFVGDNKGIPWAEKERKLVRCWHQYAKQPKPVQNVEVPKKEESSKDFGTENNTG